MNEFIERLFEKYDPYWHLVGLGKKPLVNEKRFIEAIKEACQAQRNACERAYEEYGKADTIGYNKSKIKNAEIKRQDYE